MPQERLHIRDAELPGEYHDIIGVLADAGVYRERLHTPDYLSRASKVLGTVLVGEIGSRIVATTIIGAFDRKLISSVAVEAAYRGKGTVGPAMLRGAEAVQTTEGVPTSEVLEDVTNLPEGLQLQTGGESFFIRQGYSEEDIILKLRMKHLDTLGELLDEEAGLEVSEAAAADAFERIWYGNDAWWGHALGVGFVSPEDSRTRVQDQERHFYSKMYLLQSGNESGPAEQINRTIARMTDRWIFGFDSAPIDEGTLDTVSRMHPGQVRADAEYEAPPIHRVPGSVVHNQRDPDTRHRLFFRQWVNVPSPSNLKLLRLFDRNTVGISHDRLFSVNDLSLGVDGLYAGCDQENRSIITFGILGGEAHRLSEETEAEVLSGLVSSDWYYNLSPAEQAVYAINARDYS